jgi:hypothetical protein
MKRARWMLIVWWLVASPSVWAQNTEPTVSVLPAAQSPWKYSGLYSVSGNQTALRNWNAGGQSSLNIGVVLRQQLKYSRDRLSVHQLLDVNYAGNYQGALFIKTDDKLEYNLRVDHETKKVSEYTFSAFGSLKTQSFDGFSKPTDPDSAYISRFLAPGYGLTGFGMTFKRRGLECYLSPVTGKMTVVNDARLREAGAFGVTPGETFRSEVGAYCNFRYRKEFAPALKLDSRIDLYSNYLQNPLWIDINADVLVLIRAPSFLPVTTRVQSIYDRDILVRDSNEDGKLDASGVQWKQLLGVGLSYTLGAKKL